MQIVSLSFASSVQAEQFANELTRHLDIAAPDCRIVRQVCQIYVTALAP